MEEFIGKIWHRYITQAADEQFPEAAVRLDEVRHTMAIFFRALGGEGGLRIEYALESDNTSRRTLLQRIAGSGRKVELAWRDEETLRLPDEVAFFPQRSLNRDLYLWLTALATIKVDSQPAGWTERNRELTLKTLMAWPGLRECYQRLVAAHLALRPSPENLPDAEAHQESVIRQLLRHPENPAQITQAAKYPPKPVPLWLHPNPPELVTTESRSENQMDASTPAEDKNTQSEQKKRKQAQRTEMEDGKNGLLSFRLESLWSWAEHIKLDRSSSEDDDDDVMRTAEDLDIISIAQDDKTSTSKIRLDIDLPAAAYDDIMLGEGIPVDEWDYRQQRLQKDHCRIQKMTSRHVEALDLPEKLRADAHRVRRQFEILRPQRTWIRRQNDGSEIDLENYVTYLADRKHGVVRDDMPVYRDIRNTHRDLSCLLLADLSLSTDAHINNDERVIDVIRDSLFLFSEALDTTGDRFALHGFSSRNRNHVRFYDIKRFDESYSPEIRGRIKVIKPGYFTRMGAAIRYASALLADETAEKKLLLILTDGKPNDLDKYEGRYGIEDTREAVLEAEKMGQRPFCVTIDAQASDYLPYLFGSRAFVVIEKAEELPQKLPLLYLRLTQ